MNPLAVELNEAIQQNAPTIYDLLSNLGREIFMPKGILTQSAEAKQKAHKFNATIGIATENGVPMHLPVTQKYFNNLTPAEIYPYAPPAGRPKLRELWKEKMVQDNPSVEGKNISNPVVTNALTHGLSLVADLFIDEGDVIVCPDKLWGNYRLTFTTRNGGVFETFPLFNAENGFNTDALAETLKSVAAKNKKAMVLLNFPNNPTGYTPTIEEGIKIAAILKDTAAAGTKILALTDDAYFGLFYEDTMTESLFGHLCDAHENLLAVKLDGSTKEHYAWGFRTGFITFGVKGATSYEALEKKVAGLIRGTISNCPHASQSVIEKMLQDPSFRPEHREKYVIMKGRANRLKEILQDDKFDKHWAFYPFNSGYFMCLNLKNVNAEKLRVHLLDEYGVGGISIGATDFRVAFSCIEEGDLQELFDLILAACEDLS